jgi:hypothetical protein
MNPDYILRMAEDIGRLVAALSGKDGSNSIQIEQNNDLGNDSTTVIKMIVKQYLELHKYNEAEDFLYNLLEKEPAKEHFKVADWFYSELLVTDPTVLAEHDFSMAEVIHGMKDLKVLKQKSSEDKSPKD